jgi:phenylpyruvate tautomerase PptA (4-oxalocrotonate tautomerase family)
VPDIPMFRQNTAAFVHEMPPGTFANVNGDGNYVRVQVLTNLGALDRDKQLAIVQRLTDLVATAANDAGLTKRTWVLLTEAVQGGWGLWGRAHTNDELVGAARAANREVPALISARLFDTGASNRWQRARSVANGLGALSEGSEEAAAHAFSVTEPRGNRNALYR